MNGYVLNKYKEFYKKMGIYPICLMLIIVTKLAILHRQLQVNVVAQPLLQQY